MSRSVAIIQTGVANVASVIACVERLGCSATLTEDPAIVAGAESVILPGVGTLRAGMERLTSTGMDVAVRERALSDRPTLCVCLGMHMLFEASEESPGVSGLALVAGTVERFPASVRTPQFGWNHVAAEAGGSLPSGHAYFANSFRVTGDVDGWEVATAEHGGPFVAAMRRGAIVAAQFHPELSGAYGRTLIAGWLGVRDPVAGAAC